jgi:Secretion system C-terminal sorting domain
MTRKLLSVLLLLTTLSNVYAEQAEIKGSCFYNNADTINTIRLAIHNTTGSNSYMNYTWQRWGVQLNNVDDIFFRNPEQGLLSSKLRFADVKERMGYAQLNWGVDNNQLIDHFEVERQETNGDFKTIGLVMSNIESGKKDYGFKDKLTGTESEVQYRVKSLAMDGTVSYSSIMKLDMKLVNETEIRIVPNPIAATAQLNLPEIKGSYLCRVYNMGGRMVYTARVQGTVSTLNVSQLSAGTYFMEAFHPQTGKRYYGKFRKQ